jgi:hypothetical protein
MQSLSLHSTILRHLLDSNDGNLAFAIFITFEYLISKATEYVEKIITHVKSLLMLSGLKITGDFHVLSNTMHPHPSITIISIAETDALYARQNSSGLRYRNSTRSKTGDIIKSVQQLVGILRSFAHACGMVGRYSPLSNHAPQLVRSLTQIRVEWSGMDTEIFCFTFSFSFVR